MVSESTNDYKEISILLVDDQPINRKVLKKQLTNSGVDEACIAEAENGEAACNMRSANYYDMIIMDYEMPVMDGEQATSKIRQIEQIKNDGESFILTYSSSDEWIDRHYPDANEALKKPAKIDDIVVILEANQEFQRQKSTSSLDTLVKHQEETAHKLSSSQADIRPEEKSKQFKNKMMQMKQNEPRYAAQTISSAAKRREKYSPDEETPSKPRWR